MCRLRRRKLMSLPGWRSISHMLFLPPGTKGPTNISRTIGGEAEARWFRMPNIRESRKVQKNYRRGECGEGRVRTQIHDQWSVFHLCMYSTDTLHPSP